MEDRCVVCNEIVPEGRHVCSMCVSKVLDKEAPNNLHLLRLKKKRRRRWKFGGFRFRTDKTNG